MKKALPRRFAVLLSILTVIPCAQAQDGGLVGHWTFDDPTNLGKDSASTNNAAVVGGAVSFATARVGAGALAVNGSDAYLEVPDNAALRFAANDSYTISAWVYMTGLPGAWEGIVSKSRNAAPWYGIWIDNLNQWVAGASVNLAGPTLEVDASGAIVQKWHHAAVVQDGLAATRNLYVDGALVASGNALDSTGAGPLWIGGAASVSEFFNGVIDDVRIYNRALSDQEVAQLFNVPTPTTTLPVVLLAQPADVVTFPGQPAVFSAQVNALNLTYQWYKGNATVGPAGSVTFSNGGASATLTTDILSAADNGATYYVVFSGAFGSVTSRVAKITVSGAVGLDAGLVGHWTFDDPANLGKDMASTNNGAVVGGAFSFATARIGAGALAVNGSDGHILVPDSPALRFMVNQSYTLSAWVYVTALPGAWEGVITKSRNASPWYGIWIDNANHWIGGAGVNLTGPEVGVEADGSPTPEWHHLAIVQDGAAGTRNLYLDGGLAVSGAAAGANGSGPLWIGGAASVSEYFNGLIDDVRLYNRAVTDQEITQLSTAPTPSSTLPVVLLSQPRDVTIVPGQQAVFTARANALNLSYQWYKGNSPIGSANPAVFSKGAATATLTTDTLTAADSGMTFFAVFKGPSGTLTSRVAKLTVSVPVDNLIAHYTFDNPGDLGADATGYNPGAPVGGATFSNTSRLGGGALSVDGVNGHIEVPDTSMLRFASDQSYTVSAWVKADALAGGWRGIVDKSRDVAPWYGIWISDGSVWVAGGQNVNGPSLTAGWHHAAIVQDGAANTRDLYLDGSSVASSDAIAADGTGPLWIGGAASVNEFFKGLIDDVRIYNRALTAADVNTLANASSPVPTLSVSRDAAGMVLTFTGSLQSAGSVQGPWADVGGAISPRAISAKTGQQFYRSKQ